jgi:DNA-directed RNA polymerase specialized sigma24 family protein
LRALHRKEITFAVFYARTRTDWRRMAVSLHKHWKLPPTVTSDDIEQEMLIGAWQALRKWELGRASLDGFVIWNAHNKAQKWIHQQRGCNLHTRRGPSQYAWCIAMLARDGEDGGSRVLENHTDGAPDSERDMDIDRLLAELPAAVMDDAGRHGLKRLIENEGDEERASCALYGDEEHRTVFGLKSPEHAKKVIRAGVRSVRRALLEDATEGG